MVMVMSPSANAGRQNDGRATDGEHGNGVDPTGQGAGRGADATDLLARALAGEAVAQGQDCARNEAGNLACPAVEKAFRWLMEQGNTAKDMPEFLLGLI